MKWLRECISYLKSKGMGAAGILLAWCTFTGRLVGRWRRWRGRGVSYDCLVELQDGHRYAIIVSF